MSLSKNKAPIIDLDRGRVKAREISVKRPRSGWRDVDTERVAEIKAQCYQGQVSMNIFGGVILLKGLTDVDRLPLVDDGLSSVQAWQEMSEEYEKDQEMSPRDQRGGGHAWPSETVEVILSGLPVSYATYEDQEDVGLREAWNAAKHDEENNKYRPTSVAKKISIVTARFERLKDYGAVTTELLGIYGKGKYSTVQRWVRTAKNISPTFAAKLEEMPTLRSAYIFENAYLAGHGHETLSDEYKCLSLDILDQSGGLEGQDSAWSSDKFTKKICMPLRIVELWEKTMIRRFGHVASQSSAFDRVMKMLRSKQGLQKVLSIIPGPLHGKSEADQGIAECFALVKAMEASKAGGHGPPTCLLAPTEEEAADPPQPEEPPKPEDPDATTGHAGDLSAMDADLKYRDQLRGAWKLLTGSIGSVTKMDELLRRPGSAPLQDLLSGPRAAQLQDIQSAQEAIAVLQKLCLEAGIVVGDSAAAPGQAAGSGAPEAASSPLETKGVLAKHFQVGDVVILTAHEHEAFLHQKSAPVDEVLSRKVRRVTLLEGEWRGQERDVANENVEVKRPPDEAAPAAAGPASPTEASAAADLATSG